jgi:hypothetical protein
MAPRSLFDLILKILGIFFIRDVLEAVSRTLSVLVYFPQYSSEKEALFNFGVTIPPLFLYTLFCWLLIFRTGSIIRLLRFEKNFGEDEVTFNLKRTTVLTVAVVAAGGWMLINEIPELFRHATFYYQEIRMYDRMARPDISYMVMSLLRIIFALILFIWNKPIVRFLERVGTSTAHVRWPQKSRQEKKKEKDEVK